MDAVVEIKGFDATKKSWWIQLYKPQEITAVEQNIFQRFNDIVVNSTRFQIPVRTLISTVILAEKKHVQPIFSTTL